MTQALKKGDRVRVTFEGTVSYANRTGANVTTKTLCGTKQTYTVIPGDGATIEKVEPKPENLLPVGTRVRLTRDVDCYDLHTGDVVIILEIRDEPNYPYGVEDWDAPGLTGWVAEQEIEALPEPKPEPKFKVGDRVVVATRYQKNWPGVRTIVDYDDGNNWYKILNDGGYAGAFLEDELTLAPDQTFKLRPGDKIRNTKTGREGWVVSKYSDTHPWPECRVDYVIDAKCTGPWGRERPRIPVAAIEEYEEHHPGTYEIIEREGQPF